MEITWEDFEAFVATFYEFLMKEQGVEIIGYGRNCKVGGDQIDVLYRQPSGTHWITTAVECKYLKERVSRLTVNEFFGKISRLGGVDKGVIVSRMGFTQPAVEAAKKNNITLVEMRQPTCADWRGRIAKVEMELRLVELSFHSVAVKAKKVEHSPRLETENLEISIYDAIVVAPDGTTTTFARIFSDVCREHPDEDDFTVNFTEGHTLKIQGGEGSALIETLKFKTHLTENPAVIHKIWDFKDRVIFIAKSIFENREWIWYKDGRIIEQALPQEAAG